MTSEKKERRRSSKTAPTSLEIRERWPLHWLIWEGKDAELEGILKEGRVSDSLPPCTLRMVVCYLLYMSSMTVSSWIHVVVLHYTWQWPLPRCAVLMSSSRMEPTLLLSIDMIGTVRVKFGVVQCLNIWYWDL